MAQLQSRIIEDLSPESYQEWTMKPLVDVRSGTQAQYEVGFKDILAAEGPMLGYRAYSLFAKASGVGKITSATKSKLDRTIQALIEAGSIAGADEWLDSLDDPSRKILRLPEQDLVRVRSRGSRSIDEIPPSELAEVVLHYSSQDEWLGREELYRLVLKHYDLQKLTALGRRVLDYVMQMYF